MDVKLKPVPAFYCCYLLRSTVRHSSLYVGSSPHPARRLAQHNGNVKGGAVRTSRPSLRPWEMVCIVAGFPSNIAALQFEWAWHNAHLTRHISSTDRISQPTTRLKTNAKTGKTRKKIGRPRTSLIDKLSNLHLLLRAPYFSKWPLELRFFNQQVHRTWLSWNERVDHQISSSIPVIIDQVQPIEETEDEITSAQKPTGKRKATLIGKGGVDGLDPTYATLQPVLIKLNDRVDKASGRPECDICHRHIYPQKDLFNICLDQDCTSLTHLSCLSARFLQYEDPEAIVPKSGTCPSCGARLQWSDLMRLLSLRLRGGKDIKKLLAKQNRGTKVVATDLLEGGDDQSDDSDSSLDNERSMTNEGRVEVDSVCGSDSEMEEAMSVSSIASSSHNPFIPPPAAQQKSEKYEIVIDDSEDER